MFALIRNNAVAKYPYPIADARRDNPNVSFSKNPDDEALESVGAHRVHPSTPPNATGAQLVVEETPVFSQADRRWTQVWSVRDKTAAELAAEAQELKNKLVAATQERLDAFARERSYDDIKSASDYAGCSVPKFSAEGTYCRDARAETWAKLYEMLAEVEAGTRPTPSGFADIEFELPVLQWPI